MADSTQNPLLPRKPRCKLCNNLDYRGHRNSDLETSQLLLDVAIQKLNRDCPFCRLIILSIESVVNKDDCNAKKISPEDGNENDGSVTLVVEEDKPIIGYLYYNETNHTEAEVNNTGSSPERANLKFMIYSSDEVCFSPKLSESFDTEYGVITYRRVR